MTNLDNLITTDNQGNMKTISGHNISDDQNTVHWSQVSRCTTTNTLTTGSRLWACDYGFAAGGCWYTWKGQEVCTADRCYVAVTEDDEGRPTAHIYINDQLIEIIDHYTLSLSDLGWTLLNH